MIQGCEVNDMIGVTALALLVVLMIPYTGAFQKSGHGITTQGYDSFLVRARPVPYG